MAVFKQYSLFVPAILLLTVMYAPTIVEIYKSKDGVYGHWSQWSPCMKTCGISYKGRYRKCVTHHVGIGLPCSSIGPNMETKQCNLKKCVDPIDGNVGHWGSWGECLRDCAESFRNRTRSCNKPKPELGGYECFQPLYDYKPCDSNKHCPIDWHYSAFSMWSGCTPKCGPATKRKFRTCVEGRYGGAPCPPLDKLKLIVIASCRKIKKCKIKTTKKPKTTKVKSTKNKKPKAEKKKSKKVKAKT